MFTTLTDRLKDGWNRFWALFLSGYAVPAFVISIVSVVFAQYMYVDQYLLLAATLINFGAFDVIGFTMAKRVDKEVTAYRVLQIGHQLLLLFVLYSYSHTIALPLGFLWLWWWGVCDLLYYILGGQFSYVISPQSKGFYWLWWTPYGLIGRVFNQTPTGHQLLFFSILSTALYISYLITVQ